MKCDTCIPAWILDYIDKQTSAWKSNALYNKSLRYKASKVVKDIKKDDKSNIKSEINNNNNIGNVMPKLEYDDDTKPAIEFKISDIDNNMSSNND